MVSCVNRGLYVVPDFQFLGKYHKLDLRKNNIATLPESVFSKFTIIDVRENPNFDCEIYNSLPKKKKYYILTTCTDTVQTVQSTVSSHSSGMLNFEVTTSARELFTTVTNSSYMVNLSPELLYTLSGLALTVSLLTFAIFAWRLWKKTCRCKTSLNTYSRFPTDYTETNLDMEHFSISSEELINSQPVSPRPGPPGYKYE
jgi:hypothetical protein